MKRLPELKKKVTQTSPIKGAGRAPVKRIPDVDVKSR
jgi:hypothetical protein